MSDRSDLDRAADAFLLVRGRLFGIAYRMLGSVADAEDIVQDVWLRWQRCDRDAVREPAAFLATTTTRLALTLLQSARARREAYVGPWLPEPLDTSTSPEVSVERNETIQIAVLFLLERLSPVERAAYVLREAFGYPYSEIAEILTATEVNVRQLVSRARKHLAIERHAPVGATEQQRFLTAFLEAAQAGDLAALESVLTADVVSYSDGGERFQAARIPLVGRSRVVKFVMAVSEWFWDGVDVEWVEANGQPAVRLSAHGEQIALIAVSATTEGIDRIFWMMNPEKLDGVLPNPAPDLPNSASLDTTASTSARN
ncbi:RNA polymerase sigma-70 factor [Leifsonia kafniensis]|uniref:RNA polymerase sigma-70 factor n=1 Tax=Leifsonia kafniensis TaxID=475957 RepID=A0ABP7K0S8_9MICO